MDLVKKSLCITPRKPKVAFERFNQGCNMIKFEFWTGHSNNGMKDQLKGGYLEAKIKAEAQRDLKT